MSPSSHADDLRRLAGQAVAIAYTAEQMAKSLEEAAPGAAPTEPAPEENGEWLRFSPLEEEIIAVVPRDAWMPMKTIALAVDQSSDGDLGGVLRNLVARRVLLSAQSRGYRLNAAADGRGE